MQRITALVYLALIIVVKHSWPVHLLLQRCAELLAELCR